MLRSGLLLCGLAVLLCSCGGKATKLEDFNTRVITLPDGAEVRAEIMSTPMDITRGMMFRTSLAADRGMLLVHAKQDLYTSWMYQTLIPLDILWIDKSHRVVEIAPNTPPCESKSARACPQYGGHQPAQFILELNGGMAAKHGIKVGDVLGF